MRPLIARLSFLFLSLLLIGSSCKKTTDPLDYSKEYENLTFTVDTTSSTGEILLGTQEVQTDVLNYLAENGFTLNNLKSVKVNSITISTVNANQNLDYFKKLEVRLSNQGAGNVIFASKELPDSFTESTTTIAPDDVDLKEFFKQGELSFSFFAQNDLPILPEPVPMTAKISVQVVARLGN